MVSIFNQKIRKKIESLHIGLFREVYPNTNNTRLSVDVHRGKARGPLVGYFENGDTKYEIGTRNGLPFWHSLFFYMSGFSRGSIYYNEWGNPQTYKSYYDQACHGSKPCAFDTSDGRGIKRLGFFDRKKRHGTWLDINPDGLVTAKRYYMWGKLQAKVSVSLDDMCNKLVERDFGNGDISKIRSWFDHHLSATVGKKTPNATMKN